MAKKERNIIQQQRYERDNFIKIELDKLQRKKQQELLEQEKRNPKSVFGQLEYEMIYQDRKMSSIEAIEHARDLTKIINKLEKEK